MLQVQFSCFARPRRGRCNCCDRQQALASKVLLFADRSLIGDLIMCAECTGAWEELLRQGRERVTEEWNFDQAREGA